jgi:hypothetical protein
MVCPFCETPSPLLTSKNATWTLLYDIGVAGLLCLGLMTLGFLLLKPRGRSELKPAPATGTITPGPSSGTITPGPFADGLQNATLDEVHKKLKLDYQELIARIERVNGKGIRINIEKKGRDYYLWAEHPSFGPSSFATGYFSGAIKYWRLAKDDALRKGRICRVGVRSPTIERGSAYHEIEGEPLSPEARHEALAKLQGLAPGR